MTLADFLRSLDAVQRQAFADKVERSVGYLYLVAGGHRRASPELAQAIDAATEGKVSKEELRPDLWPAARSAEEARLAG